MRRSTLGISLPVLKKRLFPKNMGEKITCFRGQGHNLGNNFLVKQWFSWGFQGRIQLLQTLCKTCLEKTTFENKILKHRESFTFTVLNYSSMYNFSQNIKLLKLCSIYFSSVLKIEKLLFLTNGSLFICQIFVNF